MKRLILLLFVLIVIGAVGFFFGWIQIRLDENQYAVIFTKTDGWEDEVIEPGTFTWRIARLLPTNLTLHAFDLSTRRASLSSSGSLPGASVYATMLDSPSPFDYNLTVEVLYTIDSAALPGLARDEGLRPDALGSYYSGVETRMEQLVADGILSGLTSLDDNSATAVASFTASLQQSLSAALPGLSIISVSPTRVEIPDLELYADARDAYQSVLEARTEAMQAAAAQFATDQAAIDAGLARLERYGEILDRYPILLEYFSLTQEFPTDPLDLEALIPPSGT